MTDLTASEIVEAVAETLCEWDWIGTPGFKWDNTREPERGNWLTMATAAIAAARPLILEEAAKVAEAEEELEGDPPPELVHCADNMRAAVRVAKRNIAAAIRALGDGG